MKISIITAAYNSAQTIRDTIESVIAQTYKDIEYIVVDGGSNDGTLDIVKEFEPRFGKRLRWVSESDSGIYDAMNKGIKMASGDVVGVLNSDDFFTSNDVIENIVCAFCENVDAVYGDVHFVNQDDLSKCVRFYSSRLFRPSTLKFGFMLAHPSFYCRKSVYERYGYYKIDYKIAADFEAIVRFLLRSNVRAKYLKVDVVTMRNGGVSTNGAKSHLISMNERLRALKENGFRSNKIFLCFRYILVPFEFIACKIRK